MTSRGLRHGETVTWVAIRSVMRDETTQASEWAGVRRTNLRIQGPRQTRAVGRATAIPTN